MKKLKTRDQSKAETALGASGRPARRPAKATGAVSNAAKHDPLETSIPLLLRQTTRYFRLGMQDRLRSYGLNYSHWFFLRALWLEDGITQRELCRRIEAVEPAAVAALGSLERAGYIHRQPDPENRRQVHIFLTEKANSVRDELLFYAVEQHLIGVAEISEQDLEITRATLNAIRVNMAEALVSGRLAAIKTGKDT